MCADGWRDQNVMGFLAEIDGEPAGGAVLAIHDGVALLAVRGEHHPEFPPAQQAPMDARLDYAVGAGCDHAD
jgi:hypothetical protein